MFSEYASRFLAQSQSRISFAPLPDRRSRAIGQDRQQNLHPQHNQRNSYVARRFGTSASSFSQLAFGYRTTNPAPLLKDVTGKDGEGEEDEHEREVADYFALQRSRKHFVHSHLEGSSEVREQNNTRTGSQTGGIGRPDFWTDDDIRSSWHGEKHRHDCIRSCDESLSNENGGEHDRPGARKFPGTESLADMSSIRLDAEEHSEISDNQHLLNPAPDTTNSLQAVRSTDLLDKDCRAVVASSSTSEAPTGVNLRKNHTTYHDALWRQLYMFIMAVFLTSFVLSWLHVSVPKRNRLGESIYGTITASYQALGIDTLLAVIISLLWLAVVRLYVRLLVYTIVLGFPLVLLVFSLYPFVFSFKASDETSTAQITLIRWLSFVPLSAAGLWLYSVYVSRHSFKRAVDLLELAAKILADNPLLVGIGFGALAVTIAWSWLWIFLFARVFLGGHTSTNQFFIVDTGSWWLGAFYVLVYLWNLGIISGIQRVTTAASVSQWYFHRNSTPAVAANAVVRAALGHALTSCFGTICLSTLFVLLVRLPVLLLPGRIMAIAGVFSTALVPDSLGVLTYPTTLTYAAIHSQSLSDAARAVVHCSFREKAYRRDHSPILSKKKRKGDILHSHRDRPHGLALQLLYATRMTSSIAFGFGAWIHAAQFSPAQGTATAFGKRGLYSYIVGLLAGAIGWAVTGALESILAAIVDAVVVCWECEMSIGGLMHYCREAREILGDDNHQRDGQEDDLETLLRS